MDNILTLAKHIKVNDVGSGINFFFFVFPSFSNESDHCPFASHLKAFVIPTMTSIAVVVMVGASKSEVIERKVRR